MIPEPEVELTPQEQARVRLTQLAFALVKDGVPVDLVMLDAREGCNLATGKGPR